MSGQIRQERGSGSRVFIEDDIPQWRRSRETLASSIQNGMLNQFEREVYEAGSWMVDELRTAAYNDSSEELIKEYASSKLYNDLTIAEQSQVGKLLDLNETPQWLYGRPAYGQASDELFPAGTYRAVRSANLMSRYVLSGLLGESIVNESPQLMEAAGQLEKTPLARAIAIGGAVLTRYGQRHGGFTEGVRRTHLFGDTYADGKATELFVGGDLHGDFRTEKVIYESDFVTDTVYKNMRHWYAPVLSQEWAAAYHTTEAHVTAGLLAHLVRDAGADTDGVYEAVMREIALRQDEGLLSQMPGPFGDYGMNDAAFAEASLRGALESPQGSELLSLLVRPGDEERLVMRTVADGVEFASMGGTMKLKTSEIPEYISLLACGAGGRTDTAAIVKMVEVLRSV